jgi:hypothetical protein
MGKLTFMCACHAKIDKHENKEIGGKSATNSKVYTLWPVLFWRKAGNHSLRELYYMEQRIQTANSLDDTTT